MPLYPGIAGATISVNNNKQHSLERGTYHYFFGLAKSTITQLPITDDRVTGETIAAGQASGAVTLGPGAEGNPPPTVCIELQFSGAPGTFELDIQEADTDADAFYITPSNSAYTVNAVNATTQIARADLSPTGGKFMRVYMKTLTNDVKSIVKITRMA